jgi:hypothetical protein
MAILKPLAHCCAAWRSPTREYWHQARIWAWRNTELWTRNKRISGLLVAIVGFLFQWAFGLRVMTLTIQFILTILTILLAYFTVSIAQFLINWLIYAPVEIERKSRHEIETQAKQIEQLQAPPPPDPIAVTVLKGQWEPPRRQTEQKITSVYLLDQNTKRGDADNS